VVEVKAAAVFVTALVVLAAVRAATPPCNAVPNLANGLPLSNWRLSSDSNPMDRFRGERPREPVRGCEVFLDSEPFPTWELFFEFF
jgi:hypothetical protein